MNPSSPAPLLTVESNEFCVLKARGAVLNVYETGQYALTTPDKPILGSIAQGSSAATPVGLRDHLRQSLEASHPQPGVATSAEMAEMAYQVDYYIHIDSREAALDLITHMPFNGNVIDNSEIAEYARPAIEQSINQIVQVTRMEHINERIFEIREAVKGHLTNFWPIFGILLNDLKVLIIPKDERMRN